MKSILFIFIMLPLYAVAQNIDISVSGGSNTTFMLRSSLGNVVKLRPVTSPAAGITFFFLRKRSAIGINLRAYSMQGITQAKSLLYALGKDTGTYTYREHYGHPSLELNLLLTHKETFGRSRVLVGAQMGALLNLEDDKPNDAYNKRHGTSGGVNLGFYFNYIYYFGHMGIGAELAPKLSMFSGDVMLMSALTVPVMLGVHLEI